jgi:hypothetical protein
VHLFTSTRNATASIHLFVLGSSLGGFSIGQKHGPEAAVFD